MLHKVLVKAQLDLPLLGVTSYCKESTPHTNITAFEISKYHCLIVNGKHKNYWAINSNLYFEKLQF